MSACFPNREIPSEDVPPPMSRLAKRGEHQIAELLGRERVAFDVGHERAGPVDDGRVQRVVHQSFVWKRLLPEKAHTRRMSAGLPVRKCQPAGRPPSVLHKRQELQAYPARDRR